MWAVTTTGSGRAQPPVEPSKPPAPKDRDEKRGKPPKEKQKLSYKESRELEALPETIESMEEEKRRLVATLNSPEFYASYDAAKLREVNDRLEALERGLDEAYHRWDELETLVVKFSEDQR